MCRINCKGPHSQNKSQSPPRLDALVAHLADVSGRGPFVVFVVFCAAFLFTFPSESKQTVYRTFDWPFHSVFNLDYELNRTCCLSSHHKLNLRVKLN